MRILFLTLFCSVLSHVVHAQVGNEWINFNQSYFKIPTAKDGLYKLTFSDLQNAGFPVSAANPQNFQLFHRGREQAIYVVGEGDQVFNATDQIVFFGQKNDGTLDAELYSPASSQPHPLYNLYSDTTSYFLTVGSTAGKRMTLIDDTSGGLVKEDFHINEKLLLLTNNYSAGLAFDEVEQTIFDEGEGWMGNTITHTVGIVTNELTGLTEQQVSASPPQLEILLVGRGPMQHRVEIYAGARLLTTLDFNGFAAQKFTSTLNWSDISATESLSIGVKPIGVGGSDRVSVAYCKIRYAQRFDGPGVNEKVYVVPENPAGKAYVQIENPAPGISLWDITDPDEVSRIESTLTSTLDAIIPAVTERRIFASSTMYVPGIHPVSFRSISPGAQDYIIITHPLLRKPAAGLNDPVEAYAEYRSSEEGGKFNTMVVNIQELYDQFNYGEISPLGIYHFMRFLSSQSPPRYLFLVGKGLDVWYGYHRNPNSFATFKDLVPSAGYPASDMAFTAGLSGTTYEPSVPTGRITASTSEEVANYLKKVKEMESLPFDELWRKDLLHLSGGINQGEPQAFKSFMQDFQAVAEGFYLGGNVTAMAKYTKDVQPINISDQVNRGLALLTFFGHSAPSTLDYEIGYVSHPINGFNNKGKYPVILINGCQAGAFFLNNELFGEDWILAPDKGSVGFIAHSGYGYVSQLKKYTGTFYDVGLGDSSYLTGGVGDIQKETARRYMETSLPNAGNISQIQQMVLLGDPAFKLFGAKIPDLAIDDNSVYLESLDGKPITAFSDSFAIKLVVRNFGQARNSTVRIAIDRTLHDNSIITYDSIFPLTKYMDTLTFVIHRGREQSYGSNSFRVTIDPENKIAEIKKDNNVAILEEKFVVNGTKNLFPTDYSITSNETIELSFQATNLLSADRKFLVELDTTNTFDSPFKQTYNIQGSILAKQPVELLQAMDTVAYYWRTKLSDPLPDESDEWVNTSFTFINDGPEGWAQVHFPQYLKNQTDGIVADSALRKFTFKENRAEVHVHTYGSGITLPPGGSFSLKIDSVEYNFSNQGFGCRTNSINVVPFDRKSGIPYLASPYRVCGRQPFIINNLVTSQLVTGNGDDLIALIDNVAAGDSVLVFTMGDPKFSTWPEAAKTKFQELGISISELEAYPVGTPTIVFGRKGTTVGSAEVHVPEDTPDNLDDLIVERTVTGHQGFGKMRSTIIGPSSNWQTFLPHFSEVEATDDIKFEIVGLNQIGEEEILFENLVDNQDLSTISASEYPRLRVTLSATDDLNGSPPQLDQWLVLHAPIAEGILTYRGEVGQQILNEGETHTTEYGFVNISSEQFPDSLTVEIEIFNQTTRKSELQSIKIAAPLPGDTTFFSAAINTLGKVGLNDINVKVNPGIVPELYYDNNIIELPDHLNVIGDLIKPVLVVLFDGRKLENGDIVSPDPFIEIRLFDSDDALLKTDTTGIKMFLTSPCPSDCAAMPVSLSGANVVVHPATPSTDFQIDYTPKDLIEGTYVLQVEASDAKGNKSGSIPYKITFVVQGEQFVRLTTPFPNPSNYEVYFPLEISGDRLPQEVDLQITSVNGQVVTHHTLGSLPELHVGKNYITWNATDTFGNGVPGGVYVYREIVTLNGQQYVQRGKIVLIR